MASVFAGGGTTGMAADTAVENSAGAAVAADQGAAAGDGAGLLTSVSEHQQMLALTILIGIGLAVPLAMMLLSWLLHRRVHNAPGKDEPYECGIRAVIGGADERFSVKFYLIAMLFLVFDLEVAFLFPWAVQFNDGGWGMVAVLLVFLVMLEAGYLYLYRKGALDWDR